MSLSDDAGCVGEVGTVVGGVGGGTVIVELAQQQFQSMISVPRFGHIVEGHIPQLKQAAMTIVAAATMLYDPSTKFTSLDGNPLCEADRAVRIGAGNLLSHAETPQSRQISSSLARETRKEPFNIAAQLVSSIS